MDKRKQDNQRVLYLKPLRVKFDQAKYDRRMALLGMPKVDPTDKEIKESNRAY